MCQWALLHGYDFVYKSDDDAYVVPERLLASGFEQFDYCGRVRGPSGDFPAPYCSGFGYWLSVQSVAIVAAAKLNGDVAEDRFVANTLLAAGIRPHHDPRYGVYSSERNSSSVTEPPRRGNNLIAVCEFAPDVMQRIHEDWTKGVSSRSDVKKISAGSLSRVCILIKTFLRDGYLFRCLEGIEKQFPDVKIVLVDDGWESAKKISLYATMREQGHSCNWLPFDSGFGAKANTGIIFCDRPYVLIASDDFDFSHPDVRVGIERMQAVLDDDPSIHITSGRVNDRPYESCFTFETANTVREVPRYRETRTTRGIRYHLCDLTVNYSLIRRKSLGPGRLQWDGGEVKIGGGEHGAFFLDAFKLGYGVALVEGANIREMTWNFSEVHPSYPQYRKRAHASGRPCLKSRGVDHWILQDGSSEET
jgi:hypothetical protein